MRHRWLVLGAWFVTFGTLINAQISAPRIQQVSIPIPTISRDTRAVDPHARRIPVGTAMISGTVTASDTGAAMAGARVELSGTVTCTGAWAETDAEILSLSRTTFTDSGGAFAFPRLPAGVYRVSISTNLDEYFDVNYGERRPRGEGLYITLADGQRNTLHVPLVRASAITGRVFAPDGAPLSNIDVRVSSIGNSRGFRELQQEDSVKTDDRGVYRVSGLRPGNYYVSAQPPAWYSVSAVQVDAEEIEHAIKTAAILAPTRPGLPPTVSIRVGPSHHAFTPLNDYLPTYAPGSLTLAGATPVTVAPNEEKSHVDIRVQLVRSGDIEGFVLTPLDPDVTVDLWLVNEDLLNRDWTSGRVDSTGSFRFSDVAPGNYVVLAQTVARPSFVPGLQQKPLTDAQRMWGQVRVTMAGGSVRLGVELRPSRSISGIVVSSTGSRIDQGRDSFTVIARADRSSLTPGFPRHAPLGVVGSDGRFRITGVAPGRYTLEFLGSHPLRSSMVGGQDTLDFPFEFTGDRDVTDAVLTVADRLGQLNGTLTDSAGKPVLNYSIVAAATDTRYWRPGSRRVRKEDLDHQGRFSFDALPPGSYQVSVVVDPEPGALSDPDYLRAIARTSVMVTIPEGGKVTQHLRVR